MIIRAGKQRKLVLELEVRTEALIALYSKLSPLRIIIHPLRMQQPAHAFIPQQVPGTRNKILVQVGLHPCQ